MVCLYRMIVTPTHSPLHQLVPSPSHSSPRGPQCTGDFSEVANLAIHPHREKHVKPLFAGVVTAPALGRRGGIKVQSFQSKIETLQESARQRQGVQT
ncbi:hypothetical protein EVAR_14474_1 [Eumeta japonica]|uniref:Uncharacterized protein n=1 Tax=Eumeta variegata TaxID=151549 RepID=A0A4C1U398_EUMVA|nr:hypothetical protein EVAR_14474_1 [Eumeta japonica]